MASTPPPASTNEELSAILRTNPAYGSKVKINNQETTVCIFGDGYALRLVTAGPNTSCKFANAVFEAQTKGLNATYDNVRDHLKSPIDVTSPVTNERYTMQCSIAPSKLITCEGGNNARVYLY